ncbi:MAG TPA: TIM barrel protein, partial [Afifellaceae bacterium]|nr:TIM barrel protein [Afifellaceae bacterium]
DAISAAGFHGVEIFENDFLTFDRSPRDVGKIVRDAGLEITLFQPFRDFECMPEPHRTRAFERAERKFDVMQELGAGLMLICSNVSQVALGGVDRAADDLAELGERAAARGLKVGYEALAWGRHVNDHRDAWEIVRRADHPDVGIILDSFHTLSRGIEVNSIRAIPKERIFLVQLADAPMLSMDLLSWSRHYRNMPGEGDLPVAGFMEAVAATGYDDVLSLEIFNDQFRGGSPHSIAVDGHRSLVALMDEVRRAEPDLAITVPPMPARVNVSGVEFVEFAVSEEEAEDLAELIKIMGFRKSARHRSKKVALYRQGDINLVVNTEREGLAHASYLLHGPSAYAFGLRVEDAAATVERASALSAEIFRQPVGPGELTIPAIRGVGGGVIYFIDQKSDLAKVWEIEFEPAGEPAGTVDAGLSRIDHLAQTLTVNEMLTWLLFYTSIFKTEKQPMVDIPDPAGLVRSQVVENPDRSFRLTLNGADNRRTIAGRFIDEQSGAGIQHIAFATHDLFATADRLVKNGFRPLDISPNYYDDVEARFGLDPEFSDRLRARNILYDQDEAGEYLQLFSGTFGEGLFFEIVERRGGYRGYGGLNAPFRIAAQRRHLRPKGMPKY